MTQRASVPALALRRYGPQRDLHVRDAITIQSAPARTVTSNAGNRGGMAAIL